jgi:hypothetical protein
MRTLILILATAASAWALDNAVTIYEASGSAQTNRPFSISRQFAEGEIAGCAQAYIGGSPVTTQTDARTRWPDGSLKHAIVSFKASLTANGSATVEFRNTASCNNSGAMTLSQITAAAWDAGISATAGGVTHEVSAKALLTALGSISTDLDALGARYLLRGPVVTQVIIEDRDPATRQADFGWEYDAGLSAWKAPSQSKFQTVHPLFVVTLYPDTPASGQYAVRAEYIARSAWMDRMQTQIYDLTLTGAGGATVYSTAGWRHLPKAAWRVTRWVANQPNAVHVDHNIRYMIHARALPQYDFSLTQSASYMDSDLSNYDSRVAVRGEASFCSESSIYCTLWYKGMGTAGGRRDIGLFPGWYSMALFAMGNTSLAVAKRREATEKFIVGGGDAAAAFPFHYQEHLTDRCYVRPDSDTPNKLASAGTCLLNARGQPLSLTARPRFLSRRNNNEETTYSVTPAEDRIAYACTSTTSPCQVPTSVGSNTNSNLMSWESENDLGHLPDWFYVPYLITGDYFYLEEMQFAAAFYMAIKVPLTASGINSRDEEKGLQNQHNNPRSAAWWMRTAGEAAVMTPDASLMRDYILQKVRNNIALREGTVNVTNGNYYGDAVRGAIWTRGRNVIAGGKDNPLFFQDLNDPSACNKTINEGLKRNTCAGASGFMHTYFVHALGWLGEILPEAAPLGLANARFAAGQITSAGYPPHMAAEFHHAVMGADNSEYLPSWADVGSWAATRCYLAAAISATSSSAVCYSVGDAVNIQGGRFLKIGSEIIIANGSISLSSRPATITASSNTVAVASGAHGFSNGHQLSFTGNGRTVSSVDASADTITTSAAHGYPESHGVRFTVSGGTLPAPLVAGTTYYVRDSTASAFKVSASRGGAAIDITSAGSGTISVTPQATAYFVVNATADTFQISASSGGPAIGFGYDLGITFPVVVYDCINGCQWSMSSITRGAANTTAASHAAGDAVDLLYFRFADVHITDAVGGYQHSLRSGTSFGYRAPTGLRAWHWVQGNALGKSLQGNALQWPHAPRDRIGGLAVSAGSAAARFAFTAPDASACKLFLNTAAPESSSDASDATIASGSRRRVHVASGLSASATYHYRLTCGTARVSGTVNTIAAGAPSSRDVELAPAANLSVATAQIEYGATASLGSSTSPVACSPRCTIAVPGNVGSVVYFRPVYRNSGSVTVATSPIQSLVIEE